MKVALGQMAVSRDSQENLSACLGLIEQALRSDAQLLVLPEGVLARNVADPEVVLKSAQALDGEFVSRLSVATRDTDLTVVFCIHTPAGRVRSGIPWWCCVMVRCWRITTSSICMMPFRCRSRAMSSRALKSLP